jgi:chromosome segregation ATPase
LLDLRGSPNQGRLNKKEKEKMATAKRALRPVETETPQRTPQRAELAQYIEKLAAVKSEITAIEAGLHFAKNEISAARSGITKAEKELEAAKADSAAIFISRAMKGAEGAGQKTIAQARAALQLAQDDLETATHAQATLNERHKAVALRCAGTEQTLKHTVVKAVIKSDPATHTFIRRFGDLEREYLTAKAFVENLGLTSLPADQELLSALLGDTRMIDKSRALWPLSDWEKRLWEDPDAQLVLPPSS